MYLPTLPQSAVYFLELLNLGQLHLYLVLRAMLCLRRWFLPCITLTGSFIALFVCALCLCLDWFHRLLWGGFLGCSLFAPDKCERIPGVCLLRLRTPR